ncbi:uncharacterized protein JCM6883_002439 [Sporobolomyces salmoneus]|uniref:uncharacterized protein n=1 Tax=Sporobolomyces salmoneus TaxID=183962 RepID=UPI00316DE30D
MSDNIDQQAPSTLSPREQALLAAEQRAKAVPSTSTPASAHQASVPFNPSRQDILTFSRIMDTQLLPHCSKTQAVETLSTLQTLLSNILSPPNPTAASKYRQIRLSNALIQRTIMNVSNSAPHDYLVACGFRRQTIEFTPYLIFPPSPTANELHKLRTGQHVLETTLRRAQEAEEREKRYRESEKDAEKARKEKALLEFEEDRRLRSERDEREKFVREARAANPQPSPPVVPRPTSPVPRPPRMALRQSRSRGIVMREESQEDFEGTPPPAYGELHGRVLGTGLPPDAVEVPRDVQMVNQQDLEDSEEDEDEEEEEEY